jgi:hypothetical protein
MKRFYLLLVGSILVLSANAQSQTDADLKKRLNEYIAYTRQMNFEKLVDYVHPNLFKIIPKDQMVNAMRSVFENEMLNIAIDSFRVLKMSTDYNYQKSLYRKIDYFISMNLKINDSTVLKDTAKRSDFIEQMQTGFPGAAVGYVEKGNYLNIDTRKVMFAVKDPNLKWMFIGFEDKQRELMEQLIPKDVLSYFKL